MNQCQVCHSDSEPVPGLSFGQRAIAIRPFQYEIERVISINAGYLLRWEPIGRARLLESNIAAYHCQLEPLAELLGRALAPR